MTIGSGILSGVLGRACAVGGVTHSVAVATLPGTGGQSPWGHRPAWGCPGNPSIKDAFRLGLLMVLMLSLWDALQGFRGACQNRLQSLFFWGFGGRCNNPFLSYDCGGPESTRFSRCRDAASGEDPLCRDQANPFPGTGGNLPVSGGRAAIVDWARAQLGVSERGNPQQVRSYSRGRWQAWCADFVSTALNRTVGSPWGHRSSVRDIYNWARRNARLTQTPRPGDAVIFNGHIALVESVNADGTITTIGGNERDAVRRARYRLNSSRIKGFVRTV